MIAHRPSSFASGEQGAQAAERLVHKLGAGTAPPDALFDALQEVLATREEPRLRMFCRLIERRVKASL